MGVSGLVCAWMAWGGTGWSHSARGGSEAQQHPDISEFPLQRGGSVCKGKVPGMGQWCSTIHTCWVVSEGLVFLGERGQGEPGLGGMQQGCIAALGLLLLASFLPKDLESRG